MPHQFTICYIEDSLSLFRQTKKLAEGAMEQVSDEQLFTALDEEMNSIAIIVKHMTGNMRSRWTDFLTSDGEKPDRNRDGEFVAPPANTQRAIGLVERLLGESLPGSRTTLRCGPWKKSIDPWRAALRDAGDQSPDRALFLSLRSDCFYCETFQRKRVEVAQCPAQQVCGIQYAGVRRRSQPTLKERRWSGHWSWPTQMSQKSISRRPGPKARTPSWRNPRSQSIVFSPV